MAAALQMLLRARCCLDLAADVADQAAKIGPSRLELPVGAFELRMLFDCSAQCSKSRAASVRQTPATSHAAVAKPAVVMIMQIYRPPKIICTSAYVPDYTHEPDDLRFFGAMMYV
jgi:hypothetical protein